MDTRHAERLRSHSPSCRSLRHRVARRIILVTLSSSTNRPPRVQIHKHRERIDASECEGNSDGEVRLLVGNKERERGESHDGSSGTGADGRDDEAVNEGLSVCEMGL